ncbi:MAG: hypothetical protein R3Y19_02845 [Rikenellaceae bacterium]
MLLNSFAYSYKLKDYPTATKELKELLESAPKASENMYINGVNIYRNLIAQAETDEQRDHYLDSLLIIFDLRAEHFAEHPTRGRDYVLAQKANTFFNFADDHERIMAYDLFVEAIKAGQDVIDDSDAALIGKYFMNVTESASFDELTADDYIGRYERLTKLLSNHDTEVARNVTLEVEAMFANSGIASCDNLERIFKPQYEADPSNDALVKKILGLFSKARCASDFQMEILERYFQTDPKPEIALMLAGVYEEKGDFAKAQEFLNVAIESESDPVLKVSHLTRASMQLLQSGNGKAAAEMAKRALEIDSKSSMAAFMYANAVSTALSGCSGDAKTYACWLAADAMQRAVNLMPDEDPLKKDARNALYNLTANFPKKTDLFMLGLEEGQAYTVNCGWLSGRTTIRGRD